MRLSTIILSILLVFCFSCEGLFDNEKLDHFWRLDYVEYKNGTNFKGEISKVDTISNVYYGFASEVVEIQNNGKGVNPRLLFATQYESSDSLYLDFSSYLDDIGYKSDIFMANLNLCGIDRLKISFHIDNLTRSTLVLSNDRTILRFTRW